VAGCFKGGFARRAHVFDAHLVQAFEQNPDLEAVFQTIDKSLGDAAGDPKAGLDLIGAHGDFGRPGHAAVLGAPVIAGLGQRLLRAQDQIVGFS
jgi:hypothetical protein